MTLLYLSEDVRLGFISTNYNFNELFNRFSCLGNIENPQIQDLSLTFDISIGILNPLVLNSPYA